MSSDQEIEFLKYQSGGAYHWDQISRHPKRSNAFVKARYRKCIDLVSRSLPEGLTGLRVADYGCGDGALAYLLALRGALVQGFDPSELALELAREQHGRRRSSARFASTSDYRCPADDGFFDAVVCSDVIEHVRNPKALLQELRRITKPGGVVVVSTPIRFTEHPLDRMHVTEYFPEEFKALVEEVLPGCEYHSSHPIVWFDLFTYSPLTRVLINLVSNVVNPYLVGCSRWRFHALQYAVFRSPAEAASTNPARP